MSTLDIVAMKVGYVVLTIGMPVAIWLALDALRGGWDRWRLRQRRES
ncbi:MAG: hypothetical protein AB7Q81_11855 [Gammaproteobacteria bacterium]